MTKPTGRPRGGARPGAGRKPKPPPPPEALEALAAQSVEALMEHAVRMAAASGNWAEVSKAGARLLNARARQTQANPGKRAERQAQAEAATGAASKFAPPPPPKLN